MYFLSLKLLYSVVCISIILVCLATILSLYEMTKEAPAKQIPIIYMYIVDSSSQCYKCSFQCFICASTTRHM